MNSYVAKMKSQPFEKAYGQELEEQDKILDIMLETAKSMRCSGKKISSIVSKRVYKLL